MTTLDPTPIAPTATTPPKTLGILSLVFGIVAIVTGFQAAFGVAAVVLGILALRREPDSRGMAIAGIVTGAVTWVLIALGIALALFFLPLAGALPWLPWTD